MKKFASIIRELPEVVPFVGPETQERQNKIKFSARLGANESVFGPSPKVIAAIKKSSKSVWMYGDPENYELKSAICAHHNVKIENVVVGEGIDSLLGNLVRLFVDKCTNVVTSKGAYPTFNYHVKGFGGILNFVPYENDFENIDALLEVAKKTKARVIYLANPDNPMGTWNSPRKIEALIESLPNNLLLCLDEAYSDLFL
jgi:histidinol-phosphate aminotransferase